MRSFKPLAVVVSSLALVASVLAVGPAQAQPQGQHGLFWLTVLHNNDAESQLLADVGDEGTFGGVAFFKTLVDDLRAEATTGRPQGLATAGGKRGALMLSSGDNFLAGPQFAASLDKGVPFFDTIAMDLIGYDSVAIGNHEFDFGPDVLADFIIGFGEGFPPYLSANLDFSGEPGLQALADQGRIAASTVVMERGERIGIVGATTPLLSFISSPRNVGVDDEVAAAIQAEVDALQASGVNKIILISHLQSIQEDLALAPELSGIDVMIAGGGDELLANDDDLLVPGDEGAIFGPYPLFATDADGNAVPVVTTSGQYRYVGRLILGFDRHGEVLAIDDRSGPVRVAGGDAPDAVAADPEVQAQVVKPVEDFVAELAATVIGTSEVDLDGRRSEVRTTETNEGNLIADALRWQATELAASFGVPEPQVALQNGGGIRNDDIVPAGDITLLDTFDMVPFPNFVSVLPDIPREQFKEILENAVSRVEFGDGRFAQVSGFSFTWDATGTAQVLDADGNVTTPGTRVREVALDDGTVIVIGGAVVAGDPIHVATIDFLARGGDQYPFRGASFTSIGVTYQLALENYIVDGLGGLISAADYPAGGEGRITRLN